MPDPRRPKRRRRVLAIAVSACALVLAATWAASLRWDVVVYAPVSSTSLLTFGSTSGLPYLGRCALDEDPPFFVSVGRAEPAWAMLKPQWIHQPGEYVVAFMPFWILLTACTLAAAALWRTDAAHGRRLRTGLCPTCTYNRTGLPATTPCPECGNPPPAPPAIATR